MRIPSKLQGRGHLVLFADPNKRSTEELFRSRIHNGNRTVNDPEHRNSFDDRIVRVISASEIVEDRNKPDQFRMFALSEIEERDVDFPEGKKPEQHRDRLVVSVLEVVERIDEMSCLSVSSIHPIRVSTRRENGKLLINQSRQKYKKRRITRRMRR